MVRNYGDFEYHEIKNAPAFLKDLGIKPVFAPRQDGYLEHYAFLDKEGAEVFACGDLVQLVEEAKKRKRSLPSKV